MVEEFILTTNDVCQEIKSSSSSVITDFFRSKSSNAICSKTLGSVDKMKNSTSYEDYYNGTILKKKNIIVSAVNIGESFINITSRVSFLGESFLEDGQGNTISSCSCCLQ